MVGFERRPSFFIFFSWSPVLTAILRGISLEEYGKILHCQKKKARASEFFSRSIAHE